MLIFLTAVMFVTTFSNILNNPFLETFFTIETKEKYIISYKQFDNSLVSCLSLICSCIADPVRDANRLAVHTAGTVR